MLAPYLTFNGNAEEAINFYANALGGKITNLQRFSDMPQMGEVAEADKKKIMHIAMEAPPDMHLMASDFLDSMGETFIAGNNFSMSLHLDSDELSDQYFAALSAGGTVIMPMSKVPWGAYFGMFNDKFGIKWMINRQY